MALRKMIESLRFADLVCGVFTILFGTLMVAVVSALLTLSLFGWIYIIDMLF